MYVEKHPVAWKAVLWITGVQKPCNTWVCYPFPTYNKLALNDFEPVNAKIRKMSLNKIINIK